MSHFIRQVLKRFRTYGFWRTIPYSWHCLDDAYRFRRLGLSAAMKATHVFIPHQEAGMPNEDYRTYQPTRSFYAFRHIMNCCIVPTQDDVFLDYGSGLGRVVMMAATYPFRRVIGVEYSRKFHEAAEGIIRPIQHRLRCREIELVNADATVYELPDDVTVVYLYNSFGPAIVPQVRDRIRESLVRRPRRLRLVGFRPETFQDSIAGCDWLVQRAVIRLPSISFDSFTVFESAIPADTPSAASPALQT